MKLVPAIVFAAFAAASFSASALTVADHYGSAVDGGTTPRVIRIDAGTRYVNVNQGDLVTLSDGSASLAWRFDGVDLTFPLSTIFPGSENANHIQVYVQTEDHG